MLPLLLAAMLAPAPAEGATTQLRVFGPQGQPVPRCDDAFQQAAARSGLEARKLGELPPGEPMLAVNKTVDGCPVAVLVRRDARGGRVEKPIGRAAPTMLPARAR